MIYFVDWMFHFVNSAWADASRAEVATCMKDGAPQSKSTKCSQQAKWSPYTGVEVFIGSKV